MPGSRTVITGGLVAAIAAGLVGIALIWRTPTPAASVPSPALIASPGQILFAHATHDAALQGWVHLAVSSTVGTTATVEAVDAGPTVGQQTITIGTQTATLLYVGKVAYLRAESATLAQAAGLPTITAADVGKWISYTPADRGYSSLITGLTLPSLVTQILNGPRDLTLGSPTTVDGQLVVPITGEARYAGKLVNVTLDVTRGSDPLPVEINAVSRGANETSIFSNWGKPVTITAPSGAQPAEGATG